MNARRAGAARHVLAVLAALALAACASGPPGPAAWTAGEACAWCRMAASDVRTAGQLVAPSEEPKFFDDVGCLAHHLAGAKGRPEAVAYVADHRTRAWVRADQATYTFVPAVETPMGSHLLAHADAASRDADPAAHGGANWTVAQVFGPAGPPGGSR